jgi:hypothetical protein
MFEELCRGMMELDESLLWIFEQSICQILVSQKPGFGSKTLAGYENKFWSLNNQVMDPKH